MNNRLISAFLCVLLVEQLTGCKLHQPRFVADSEQTASSPTNTPEPSGPARVTTNPGDSNATPTVVFSVRLPISTVSPAESIRMLREMLAVKPNCDLPCFMSITPSQEIQQSSIDWILEQPYHNVTSKTASFAIVDEEQNKDFDYSFDVAVILENRIVDSIKIIAQSSGGRVASTHLPNDLKTFGWDDVLRKYGEPDSMQLVIEEIAAEKDTTLAYQFRLVYLDRGIAFEYTGPITFEPKTKKISSLP
ncbi:MAG: hypothetical protein HC853_00460 [Anaerolineae bacterium]|nr:hypothetical protein [Anaerolineae bacterium]